MSMTLRGAWSALSEDERHCLMAGLVRALDEVDKPGLARDYIRTDLLRFARTVVCVEYARHVECWFESWPSWADEGDWAAKQGFLGGAPYGRHLVEVLLQVSLENTSTRFERLEALAKRYGADEQLVRAQEERARLASVRAQLE